IRWESFTERAEVAAHVLVAAVKRVAAAALLARHWPSKGRHDASMALAGGLLRAVWATADVEKFLGAVAAAAQDGELRGRVRTVPSANGARAGGGRAAGWTKWAEIVGEPVVARVCDWLGVRAAGPGGAARPAAAVREVEPYRPFPVAALPAPLAEYVRQAAA